MKPVCVLLLMLFVAAGCRSRDNAAGFDQAVQDIKQGVSPTDEARSEEFQQGYREVVDKLEGGIKQQSEHKSDQDRAQKLHERLKEGK